MITLAASISVLKSASLEGKVGIKEIKLVIELRSSLYDVEEKTETEDSASLFLEEEKFFTPYRDIIAAKWAVQVMVMKLLFTDNYHQGTENVSKFASNKQFAYSKDFT